MKIKVTLILFLLALLSPLRLFQQSVAKGDFVLSGVIGTPHLYKKIVKLAVNSRIFKEKFGTVIEISDVRGINPVAIKGEYALDKMFTFGINYSTWKIKFDITDHYNVQNVTPGGFYNDSIDVYKVTVTSRSYGIRPNFHFPIEDRMHDVYIGMGLGFTSNSFDVQFSSTDAGRFASRFTNATEYGFSLPGGIYIAPSLGYRAYLGENLGLNFEIGYEKGAFLLAGIALRLNTAGKKDLPAK